MKKVKYVVVLLLAILSVRTYGDIIVRGPSPYVCIKITNLKDYPDIAVVGVSESLADFSYSKVDIVNSNSCIEVHRACTLTFYAVKTDYLKEKGFDPKLNHQVITMYQVIH